MPVHLILRLRQLLFLLVRGGVIWAIPAVMTKTTSNTKTIEDEEKSTALTQST